MDNKIILNKENFNPGTIDYLFKEYFSLINNYINSVPNGTRIKRKKLERIVRPICLTVKINRIKGSNRTTILFVDNMYTGKQYMLNNMFSIFVSNT